MNWSRGFFRIWIIYAALSFALAGWLLYADWPRKPVDIQTTHKTTGLTDEELTAELDADEKLKEYNAKVTYHILGMTWGGIGLPLIVLAAGGVVAWALRGFRKGG
jgi:hypothetical protein